MSTKSPKISIIVPVYKAEKYLYRCVDSILAQTFSFFEVLLIDDGSPDVEKIRDNSTFYYHYQIIHKKPPLRASEVIFSDA